MRHVLTLAATLLAAAAPAAVWAQKAPAAAPNDDPSYRKEFVYGINFNTKGGLIGGVSVRSSHVLNEKWSRYWSIEGVEVKHPKERRLVSNNGGSFVRDKANFLYVLRPTIGVQRVIFRKAPEAGVQVNALFGAGPSIGLQMPYYIYYDYTPVDPNGQALGPDDIRAEAYDPRLHGNLGRVLDRAPLFSGINEVKPLLGAHIRAALSFEYGRYRDAVAGIETGFLLEAYGKRPIILSTLPSADIDDNSINNRFYPSVYLTIYLGSRS
ncbi:hypothetical protein [Hymenobacter canadensis]|uniref:Uncharacterized protein n=1 Tax=Hymenobacter canadensis TaxID=2999067 RepID=A0ABY7LLR2_9BACT|nr:hypothetical protein [Hymenobacter canadensis]WBA40842.1 hypothetical protein O3303_13545 [Hymenobacter canadensis]